MLSWQWRRETCCPWPTRMWLGPGGPAGGSSPASSRRRSTRAARTNWGWSELTGTRYGDHDGSLVDHLGTALTRGWLRWHIGVGRRCDGANSQYPDIDGGQKTRRKDVTIIGTFWIQKGGKNRQTLTYIIVNGRTFNQQNFKFTYSIGNMFQCGKVLKMWMAIGLAAHTGLYKSFFSRSRKNCVTFAKIFWMYWTSISSLQGELIGREFWLAEIFSDWVCIKKKNICLFHKFQNSLTEFAEINSSKLHLFSQTFV